MILPELKSKIGEDISILVRLDNHTPSYICECGDASELTLKECQNTEGIFISHTHIDHFINFDQILRHQNWNTEANNNLWTNWNNRSSPIKDKRL